jgi:acetyltransferase-like isoleucine patch superfamily enzyme
MLLDFRQQLDFIPGLSLLRSLYSEAKLLPLRLALLQKNVYIGFGSRISEVSFEGFSKIYPRCSISKASVGLATYICSDSKLVFCNIGRYCSIGPEVMAGLGAHPLTFPSTHPAFFSSLGQSNVIFQEKSFTYELPRSIEIGHDVWIGARAIIFGGVQLGTGSVVAAGAVVTKSVPPYAVVAGVPARIIKYRFSQDKIDSLLSSGWWELSLSQLSARKDLFAQDFNLQSWPS